MGRDLKPNARSHASSFWVLCHLLMDGFHNGLPETLLEGWRSSQSSILLVVMGVTLLDWWMLWKRGLSFHKLFQQASSHIFFFVGIETIRWLRAPLLLALFYQLHVPNVLAQVPIFIQFLVAFFGVDLFLYAWHRVLHETELGWANHSVHHTAEVIELSLGARIGALQRACDDLIYAPLCVLGIHPLVLLTAIEINRLFQFWTHTEHIPSLGFLDRILNTPAVHRIHHEASSRGARSNFGSAFMIWDHLFGTWTAPSETRTPLVYGAEGMSPPPTVLGIQMEGYVQLFRRSREAGSFVANVIVSVFIVLWAILTFWHYDARVFFWPCSAALVLTLFATWEPHSRLPSIIFNLTAIPGLLFASDLLQTFVTHSSLGPAGYMFDPQRPWVMRLISLFHVWLPIWAAVRVRHSRKNRNSFLITCGLSFLLFFLTALQKETLCASSKMFHNINYICALPSGLELHWMENFGLFIVLGILPAHLFSQIVLRRE